MYMYIPDLIDNTLCSVAIDVPNDDSGSQFAERQAHEAADAHSSPRDEDDLVADILVGQQGGRDEVLEESQEVIEEHLCQGPQQQPNGYDGILHPAHD